MTLATPITSSDVAGASYGGLGGGGDVTTAQLNAALAAHAAETNSHGMADSSAVETNLLATANLAVANEAAVELALGYEVWLKIGQSNAVGGDSSAAFGATETENPRLFELSRGIDKPGYTAPADGEIGQHFPTAQDDDDGTGPGFYFGLRRCELNPSLRVLMVNAAVDGSSFTADDWNPGDAVYDAAVAEATTAMAVPGARFGGFLWHQGGSDTSMNQSQYEIALEAMVTGMREEIPGALAAPFILSNLSASSANFDAEIDAAHRNVGNVIDNAWFVDASDLDTFEDTDLHWDRPALLTLATRWADQAQELMTPGWFVASPVNLSEASFAYAEGTTTAGDKTPLVTMATSVGDKDLVDVIVSLRRLGVWHQSPGADMAALGHTFVAGFDPATGEVNITERTGFFDGANPWRVTGIYL